MMVQVTTFCSAAAAGGGGGQATAPHTRAAGGAPSARRGMSPLAGAFSGHQSSSRLSFDTQRYGAAPLLSAREAARGRGRQSMRAGLRVSAQAGKGRGADVSFPRDYGDVVLQVQAALKACLEDGNMLVEIEFPTGGLEQVPGDTEGAVEMTQSMNILRDVVNKLARGKDAEAVRIFLPDDSELERAKPLFEGLPLQLGYLTKPSGLLDIGIDFGKRPIVERVEDSDRLFIVAYPSFNVNEMLTVEELYDTHAQREECPIVTFNGELDRIRSGYYWPVFYPKIAKLGETFLPKFETAYYIHNFKGNKPGVLFRAYPGPWQVLRRTTDGGLVEVASMEERPTLKEVALDIL
mmetsp:Transcript_41500/g.132609  ORF Transcript_41500/g.132609 Transcript_41500/m.132609 type:complete len:350 (+) Transcript_41500:3-1052(+)